MNPKTLQIIFGLFSMKSEIKYIFYTFLTILLVPILIVIILTQAGFNIISDALATSDPQTQEVIIHNPANGETLDRIAEKRMWPTNGVVTLEFAEPNLPYYLFHTGIDIAEPQGRIGSEVVAFMAGKVKTVKHDEDGYGNHVVIQHRSYLVSLYGHLDSILVEEGQDLIMGDTIGVMGTTGTSSGPHLHFEIRIFYIPINPRIFLTGDPP